MSSPVLLRGYRADDFDALCALDDACFDRRFRFSRKLMREYLALPAAIVTVAEATDGTVAGFALFEVADGAPEDPKQAYGVTLDVALAHRRAGLARRLLQATGDAATAAGCGLLWLHVFVENRAAIQLYEACGFTCDRRERNFYGRGLDAWVYIQVLMRV